MSFGFRVARPAGHAWNLGKTLVQITAFWGLFLFLLPAWIAGLEEAPRWDFPARRAIAAAVFAAGGSLGLWSGWTMTVRGCGTPLPTDCPRRLVVAGPYAHIRNPMAVGGLAQGAASALWLGSTWVLAYVAAGMAFWNWCVRRIEERDLAERFGAEYAAYRDAVKCWVPRRTSYRPARCREGDLVKLVERRFDENTDLKHHIYTCELGGEHHARALVLRFIGRLLPGSSGNANADYIRVVMAAALEAWHCHALVFDFRELAYEYGNGIWGVFESDRLRLAGPTFNTWEPMPTAMVVSELCRAGFSTCAKLVPPMYDELDTAIESVTQPARDYLVRTFRVLDDG